MDKEEYTFQITMSSQMIDAIVKKVLVKAENKILDAVDQISDEQIKKTYTLKEVAKILDVEIRTMQRTAHANKDLFVRIGGKTFITENNLRTFLKEKNEK